MIKNIGWTLGNDCPCRCKHCYSFSVRQKGQNLTKEIVDKVIEQIEKLNVETVNLGGNEPIFTNGLDVKNSMLPYILKELNKRNIKVGITTAGISLIALKNTYPECLELLNDVDISLDSPFENEHNENRGGDVYKYAIQALEICKEYNIESGIIMCAMNLNFTKDRIDALLEIAKKYDSNIRFNLLKPIQPQHFKLVPSKEQVLENYKYLFEKCDTVELSEPILSGLTQNNKVKGCACGIYSMRINSITPDGKIPVSPCVYMHDYRVGDLLKDDIIENIFVSKAPLIIQDIKEIQDLNCILNLENTKTTQCLKETLREYNVDIKSNMMSDATEVRVDAVKRNMGIAYVIKKSVKRELEAKELYEVELPIKLPSVKLNLIYLKGELSKVSKSFIKNYLRNKE